MPGIYFKILEWSRKPTSRLAMSDQYMRLGCTILSSFVYVFKIKIKYFFKRKNIYSLLIPFATIKEEITTRNAKGFRPPLGDYSAGFRQHRSVFSTCNHLLSHTPPFLIPTYTSRLSLVMPLLRKPCPDSFTLPKSEQRSLLEALIVPHSSCIKV